MNAVLMPNKEPRTPIIGAPTFNARVDADSIMASLARQNGQTLRAEGGVSYFPIDRVTMRKAVGQVWLPSGIVVNAESFFKITSWQDDYARRLIKFLNYELHHDGVWAVMWLNPTIDGYATEIRFAFQDEDGDVQFVVESDLTLVDLQSRDDASRHGKVLEEAYQQYRDTLAEVDVRPDQMIKAAKGQRQKDPNDLPEL